MNIQQRLAIAAIAAAAVARPHEAGASESRFVGDDVRVTLDEAGVARVDHAIALRVSGASPRELDVTGVEPEATADPTAPVTIDGETTNAAHVERKNDRALHVTFDAAPRVRGEKTRTFVVRVSYALDLVRARELTLDGPMWRLSWTSPTAPEGYDGARVVVDLPAAPTEPRAIASDGSAAADGRVVTVRRGAQRDELEMERPHVAKGEAATWLARVDPRAFPRVVDASLRAPAASAEPARAAADRGLVGWGAAIAVGVLFGLIVRAKAREVGAACAEAGTTAEGLVPWSSRARSACAGLALGAAVASEIAGALALGGLLVVVAMVFAANRAPRVAARPRGPGEWLAIAPGEAFRGATPSSLLDATTTAGRATLALAACASIAIGVLAARVDASFAWLAPLDACALVAVLFTGCASQLPPDRARGPAGLLASLHRALRRDRGLHVTPWARVPRGTSSVDELRLLVVPRAATPGLAGIEVGVGWARGMAGYVAEPEVLVRVQGESPAASRMTTLAHGREVTPGRKLDERVVRVRAPSGGRGALLRVVRTLAGELADRRSAKASAAWAGAERRRPVGARTDARAAAAHA